MAIKTPIIFQQAEKVDASQSIGPILKFLDQSKSVCKKIHSGPVAVSDESWRRGWQECLYVQR